MNIFDTLKTEQDFYNHFQFIKVDWKVFQFIKSFENYRIPKPELLGTPAINPEDPLAIYDYKNYIKVLEDYQKDVKDYELFITERQEKELLIYNACKKWIIDNSQIELIPKELREKAIEQSFTYGIYDMVYNFHNLNKIINLYK